MTNRITTKYIVLHRSERFEEALSEYHWFVRRDGAAIPCLQEDVKGAHALNANGYTVGIAIEGCFTTGYQALRREPTKHQLTGLQLLVRRLLLKYVLSRAAVIRHYDLGLIGTSDKSKLIWEYSCPGDIWDHQSFISTL